jgi:spore maturation protein CgeB
MQDEALRRSLAAHGLETIRRRHTCAHRVDELMGILQELRRGTPEETLSI